MLFRSVRIGRGAPVLHEHGDEADLSDLKNVVRYLAKGPVKEKGENSLTAEQAAAAYAALHGRRIVQPSRGLAALARYATSPPDEVWMEPDDEAVADVALFDTEGDLVSIGTGEVLAFPRQDESRVTASG